MNETTYRVLHDGVGAPIKAWTEGVPTEAKAEEQLLRMAKLPFIHKWLAVMPDVHLGIGATVGSVVPTSGAIVPAAVGVDIGCGMMAVRTSLRASDLPESLRAVRSAIESVVPVGNGRWNDVPDHVGVEWASMKSRYDDLVTKHPAVRHDTAPAQLGTLGTGNHFIEVCLDESDGVWFMLHSGSRGVGNRIGSYFIARAREEMKRWFIHLPDENLAYLPEGSELFGDYVASVSWAQDYAAMNRELMMRAVVDAVRATGAVPSFEARLDAVNCHHNYVEKEHHYGRDVWVTRKGAVRARVGDHGIIPGSMGARSYIVRGKGNPESFCSCSHGAGRVMSRTEAKKRFTVDDHRRATEGVECRKDEDVIDETPAAYKDIDAVMHAQRDLVEVVHTLKQVLCVKG